MVENYIAAYRSSAGMPIGVFVNGNTVDSTFPVTCEDDLIKIVQDYCLPLDNEVVVKKTLLDYGSFLADRDNIIAGMLNIVKPKEDNNYLFFQVLRKVKDNYQKYGLFGILDSDYYKLSDHLRINYNLDVEERIKVITYYIMNNIKELNNQTIKNILYYQ